MSIGLVFSLDYEIHGNGGGSPMQLMVEPTWRMMRQFDRFGAKLTIFAEVAEILRFRDHLKASGRDTFHYNDIVEQLRHALGSGHDVQLHLHPSYVNAVLTGQRWEQDWSEYDMAQLPASRIRSLLATA